MSDASSSNRREFITGRGALKAIENLADQQLAQPPHSGKPSGASHLVEISRDGMGSEFQLIFRGDADGPVMEAALEALDVIERLEADLSVFRESSVVSRINRDAGHGWVPIDREVFDLLELASSLGHETNGAFDITASPLWRLWGFHRRAGQFPGEDSVKRALENVGYQWLKFEGQQSAVRFERPGMEINLGAIGKGYALDRCSDRLNAANVTDYLIHGGQSSVLARGHRNGTEGGWRIGIRHPLRPEKRVGEVRLVNCGLGTSGSANQFFYHQSRRYSHILDPRTGWPADRVLSSTVISNDATTADALSTAFFAMGIDEARDYCAHHPHISALLVLPGERSGELKVEAINMIESKTSDSQSPLTVWERVDVKV